MVKKCSARNLEELVRMCSLANNDFPLLSACEEKMVARVLKTSRKKFQNLSFAQKGVKKELYEHLVHNNGTKKFVSTDFKYVRCLKIVVDDFVVGEAADKINECYRDYTTARYVLVMSNLRLVRSFARCYSADGMTIEDFIEEGNHGLLKAVDRFDPDHYCKLSTYAGWWIKQSITRNICEKSRIIHIPTCDQQLLAKLRQFALDKNNAKRTFDEMYDLLLAKEGELPEREILRAALQGSRKPMSLSSARSKYYTIEDGFSSFDPVDNRVHPETICEIDDNKKYAESLLAMISPREADILRMHYGFNSGHPMSLQAVGKVVNLSRERIRQIKNNALTKLQKLAGMNIVIQVSEKKVYEVQHMHNKKSSECYHIDP